MPLSSFKKINKEITDRLAEEGYNEEEIADRLLKNPRNAAAGTVKMQDSSVVAKRNLDCFLYFVYGEKLPFKTHDQTMEAARTWGFKVSEHGKTCQSMKEVMRYLHHWDKARHKLPYDTDGVVIKVNSYAYQKELGFTAKS